MQNREHLTERAMFGVYKSLLREEKETQDEMVSSSFIIRD